MVVTSVAQLGRAAGRRVFAAAAILAAGLLAWFGWFGWCGYRSRALWHEANAAAEVRAWDRVAAALDRRAWYQPHDLEAIRLRAQAALRSGDREGAARVLKAVRQNSPMAEWAHFQRGRVLKELYRPAAAIDEFRACLRLNPLRIDAHRELTVIFGIERRASEQEAQLWRLHDCTGGALEALRMLAQSAVTIPPDALARDADEGSVLRRCLEANPDDPAPRAPLGYFLRNRGLVAEARAVLEPALGEPGGDPGARLEDLACLLDEGDVDASRPSFERPDERLEAFGRYWLLRGDWFGIQGRHAEALENHRNAVCRDPRDAQARYRLSQSLRAAGRIREAEAALLAHERIVQLSQLAGRISLTEPNASQLLEAARICRELGRDREARAWCAAVLRVDPSRAEARRLLAELGPPGAGADATDAKSRRGKDPRP
jgi:tetratricopeptide (TPR) repeat protein